MPAFGFLLGLAFAAIMVSAPAGAAVFKWANDGDVGSMDPYTLNETVQNGFLANIYERLVQRNKVFGLEPGLAISWERTSSLVWRFKLRPNVKWQDGTPFTADDVVFSYQRISGKNSQKRSQVISLKSVYKIDNLTIDIETKHPDPILPTELAASDIMSKAWCQRHNAVENAVIGKGDSYSLHNAMGTGPYRLVSREPGLRTVLEKNPIWWGTAESNVDRVEFNVIGNASTRIAALLSGEVDMIYSVPPQDMDRIRNTSGVHLIQGPELRTIYLGLDQDREELLFSDIRGKNPFKDVRVRRAFALAIDEDAIATHAMRGMAHPTWLMWGPGVNGYDRALDKRPPVDLVKAKSLLAEAGYPDGFRVTLDCPNDRYVMDEGICTAISAMLARIGVKVDVFARTKVKFFADTGYPEYKTSFYLLGWTTYDAANVFAAILASRGPGGRGQSNSAGYHNQRVDELTDLIAVELNNEKRQALIDEGAKIVQDEVGFIPLHQQVIVWAARDNVELTQPPDNSFPMRWVSVK